MTRIFIATLLAAFVSTTTVAHAQSTLILTMSGPSTAVSGQEITYRVHYRFTDPSSIPDTGFRVSIPDHTTLVLERIISGTPAITEGRIDGDVYWFGLGRAEQPEGQIELIVRIDADFVGSIRTSAYVPEIPVRTKSNIVETRVFAPGTLPETGTGGHAGSASEQEPTCGRPRQPGELAIIGRTSPPVEQGTVHIPELDLTSEIVDGCFEFRSITLPQDPMLVSFEIRVEGYRPATWANYIVLSAGSGPNFTPRLEPGDRPELIDPCPRLLSTLQEKLSAVGQLHAALCAQLPSVGTGIGRPSDSGQLLPVLLLALTGASLAFGGAALQLTRRR